jgi:DnaD/phage-associated family protein
MGRLTLYNDSTADDTLVSNRFIDEYMKDANDAQLKVYLYLIRMLGANLATSISDIADKFNHTEKDVIRALKYWEQLKLLHLDYDEHNHISGIHIQDLDKMPSAEIVPLTNRLSAAADKDTEHDNDKLTVSKPSYSPDQIKAYKDNEDFSRILFISEQYLQRPLTPSDIQTFLFVYDKLHLSVDLVDYLVEYCVEHHKTSHLYIEKVAMDWADSHITTVAQAKAHASQYDKSVYTIMKALGNHNAPTDIEYSMIQKWTNEYAFSLNIILKACERSVLATTNNRIRYADRILSNWYKSGVHSASDIDALDAAHAQKPAAKQESKTSSKTHYNNTFNQFEQRSYDFDALEKELLSN